MDLNPLEMEFQDRAVRRGGVILFAAQDALELVKRAREERVRVLGIDGFFLTGDGGTQPSMRHSIDLSNTTHRDLDSWTAAESFLKENAHFNLYFEVVMA